MSPKKIYIIGPSGSGKTTLGRLLAERFQIPHFDLDHIAYPNKQERPHTERLHEIEKLANQKSWITEGIYVHWTGELFERADWIIWLDLAYPKTLFRVIKRFLIHKFRGDETHGVHNTLRFIWNLRKYYYPKKGEEQGTEDKQTTRHKTRLALKPFKEKLVHIQSSKQLNTFLESL